MNGRRKTRSRNTCRVNRTSASRRNASSPRTAGLSSSSIGQQVQRRRLEQLLLVAGQSATDELGGPDVRAGIPGDGGHHCHHPRPGEAVPRGQRLGRDVAPAGPALEDAAHVRLSPEGALAAGEPEHVPVAGEEALLGGQTGGPGEVDMRGELAQLAVDGDEVSGAYCLEHPPLLRPGRMAGDVEAGLDAGVHHPRPGGEQGVDQHAHRPLVSGDGPGAEEHRVPPLDAQPFDLRLQQLGERRPGLSLRTGGEDAHVMGQEALRLLGRAEQTLGNLEAAGAPGGLHVPLQAPAREDQASSRPVTDVDDVLHAVQMRGEETHQHPAASLGNEAFQRLGDDALGRGLPLDLGVGRVAQEAHRLAVRQRLQSREVRGAGVERCLVELEVAGVDDRPLGRAQQEPDGVGDGVRDPEGLDLERRGGMERFAGEDSRRSARTSIWSRRSATSASVSRVP